MLKLVKCEKLMGGLHWVYGNPKGQGLSIICHNGSFGRENGLFEASGYGVKEATGNLTFGEVQKLLNKLERAGGASQ